MDNLFYFNKFSKYFNKVQTGGNNLNILIVVDVQNCFLSSMGTLGWQSKNPENTQSVLEKYILKLKQYIDNSSKYDMIIYTKDTHPEHHLSHGTLVPHCVSDKICEKNKEIAQKSYEKSFFNTGLGINYNDALKRDTEKINTTFKTKIIKKTIGRELISNLESHTYDYKITFDKYDQKSDPTKIQELSTKTYFSIHKNEKSKNKKPIIVRLNKGELCNFDAYSAFMYHVYYENGTEKDLFMCYNDNKPLINSLNVDVSNLSTGLKEFLENLVEKQYPEATLHFDVCGVVTNICVVSTCVGGCYTLNNSKIIKKYSFNILNELCLNLHAAEFDKSDNSRNATRIINRNNFQDKIKISHLIDCDGYHPHNK